MNKVILMGRLTRDPEMKYIADKMCICKFSIANNEGYGDNKKLYFFNVVTFNKTAENCGKYLKKGSKVLICGTMAINSYENKDGVKKTNPEIIGNQVEFLTPKQNDDKYASKAEPEYKPKQAPFKNEHELIDFPEFENTPYDEVDRLFDMDTNPTEG